MKNRALADVPPDYLMMAQLMQIAGLMNLLGGVMATMIGFLVCVGTYGCCFPFIFFGIPSMLIGVFELQWGTQASRGRRVPDLRQKALWGLMASVLLMVSATMAGVPALILEIVIQTKLNDREVTAFLRGDTSSQTPLLTDGPVT